MQKYVAEYRNPLLVRGLQAFHLLNLVFGFYLLATGNLIAIPAVVLSSALLWALFTKWYRAGMLVRLWAAMLFIGGGSKLLSDALRLIDYHAYGNASALEELSTPVISFLAVVQFAIGLMLFQWAKWGITPRPVEPDPAEELPAANG